MNTIIEKIRAEVERLKQEIYPVKVGEQRVNRGPTSMESAALGALNTLMSRISTLQEKSEKPINQDDIDTEIGHWMDHLDDKYCMLVNHYSIQDIKDTARHFYELGRQSKPVLSDDLEKVAREYAMDDFYNGYSSGSIVEDTMKNFKAGAEWQKEQMMREKQHDEFSSNVEQESLNLNPYERIVKCALDGVTRLGSLCDDKAIIDAAKLCVDKLNEQMMKGAVEGFIFQSEDYYPKELIANYNGELKHGDKVRIIIVNPE